MERNLLIRFFIQKEKNLLKKSKFLHLNRNLILQVWLQVGINLREGMIGKWKSITLLLNLQEKWKKKVQKKEFKGVKVLSTRFIFYFSSFLFLQPELWSYRFLFFYLIWPHRLHFVPIFLPFFVGLLFYFYSLGEKATKPIQKVNISKWSSKRKRISFDFRRNSNKKSCSTQTASSWLVEPSPK